MTFVEKKRLDVGRSEKALLKVSWEGELFGVGLFEAAAERFPEHADVFTACATMEWINIHDCEPLGHSLGVHITLEEAEKLGREGEAFARHLSFKHLAEITSIETAEADELYEHMGKHTDSPELKTLADDLYDHENALRDWMKSELAGNSDGGEKVFAWLERHGVSRSEAITPRKLREDVGGDKQELVLAFFDTEDAADAAAETLRNWEKASEYMRVDAIGVLVKDDNGKVKEHKLGRRAGKHGMGIGVALGVVAAIPTGGLSLAGGLLGGAAGGGVIGQFFHKGLKMSDEDATRISGELDAGHAAVGVLTWDFETQAVSDKLTELGGTPQTHEVAKLPAETS
ncbi:hypothetical protein [Streptomyces vilmorinianum]|uniref:hypothetical protein n=1 Tax=Streptomyces vilmorinianum TaxID=3051092 RepID=UPI0010FB12B3|nr:hypothetical protein [Streptomyces vilmorinianum]